jgi:hypothetical protein
MWDAAAPSAAAGKNATSADAGGTQFEGGNTGGNIETGLAFHADRLQRE